MVQSFEVQFFLNCREGDLLGEGCFEVLDLLTLQVLGSVLQVGLEDLHPLVLIHLGPIPHPLLSHHGLAVDTLRSVYFLPLSFFPLGVVIIDGLVLLPFLFDQLKFAQLDNKILTLLLSIFSKRYPSCWIRVCQESKVFCLNLAKVSFSLSPILVLSSIFSQSSSKNCMCSDTFSCFTLWLSSAQQSFDALPYTFDMLPPLNVERYSLAQFLSCGTSRWIICEYARSSAYFALGADFYLDTFLDERSSTSFLYFSAFFQASLRLAFFLL